MIDIVFGTRPELIKLYPLLLELKKRNVSFRLIFSNQHDILVENLLVILNLTYDLKLTTDPSQKSSMTKLLALTMNQLDDVWQKRQPALVLVHGDTATALAAALAAFENKIPVAHVEAGLRSGNLKDPWPEEGNRVIIDQVSEYLFVPSARDAENVKDLAHSNVFVTGNTIVDAVNIFSKFDVPINENLRQNKYLLVTLHRRESQNGAIDHTLNEISKISKLNMQVVFIMHPNPNVLKSFKLIENKRSDFIFLDPVPYPSFLKLIERAGMVFTDSGGLQEECAILGKPLLIARDTTERKFIVEHKFGHLVGKSNKNLGTLITELWEKRSLNLTTADFRDFLGDGSASKKIVNHLIKAVKE